MNLSLYMYIWSCLPIEVHKLWSKPQQPIQRIKREFPRKQETHIASLPIVLTTAPAPQLLQKRGSHIRPDKLGRVGPAPRPVNPSQSPIRIPLPESHVDIRRQIMLIRIARTLTVALKHWKINIVWNDLNRKIPVHREPLWALSPVLELDGGAHLVAVAAPANASREIVELHEVAGRVD